MSDFVRGVCARKKCAWQIQCVRVVDRFEASLHTTQIVQPINYNRKIKHITNYLAVYSLKSF